MVNIILVFMTGTRALISAQIFFWVNSVYNIMETFQDLHDSSNALQDCLPNPCAMEKCL